MIFEALSCLSDELNEYLRSKNKLPEEKIIVSGIMNQDGTVAARGQNKVLITVTNIEKETTGGAGNTRTSPNTSSAITINLFVLFSAYFTENNYPEALRFISFIIGYFQIKNVFTKVNSPKLDPGIEKLILEMESLSTERLNNLWATLGAKYMPSVMYKVRMLSFDNSIVREFRPGIEGIEQNNVPIKNN